ncbi:MAG: PAS domain S-box protein [Trebonia sp.]
MRQLTDAFSVALLEAAPDAVVCVDSRGRMVLVNAQAERLFGYRREELDGKPVEILVPDAARAGHPALRGAYGRDPRPRAMGEGQDLTGRRRDGSTFPAEISLSAIGAGEGMLVMAAVRDATRQREAAVAAARLASIIQSSHDAVIGQTVEQVITTWNPAAEQLYGYSAAEMIGGQIDMLIPPALRAAEHEIQAAIIRGERIEQFQAQRIRKDGTMIEVSVTLSPIADRQGTVIGVSRISRDLSTQQRADVRFRGLLESAPDAMVCVDSAGQITLVNAQAERLFGYSRQELAGQPVEILVPDAASAGHPALRGAYGRDPRPRAMGEGLDLTARRRDGSTFPAEISLSAIGSGEEMLVSAAVRDISERLRLRAAHERLERQAEQDRLERKLQQSQRLESLGELAGGVAHDFNNLLSVISGYTAFIRDEVTKDPPHISWQDVREDLAQVEEGVQRAAQLTRQLLTFGRREVSQPRPLDLGEVVADMQPLLAATLREQVELATELAPCPVLADAAQIEQVLLCLAVNARDAMPRGGTLIIRTGTADADETATAGRPGPLPPRDARLTVSDTGTGMLPEVAERAFEPFFTTKARGQGPGLGLSTVYGIITQAGGDVQIRSEPGTGTTVTILLPQFATQPPLPPAQQAPPPPRQAPRDGDGATVLIAEDQAELREVARRILTGSGYHVITAADGLEAIRAAAAHPGAIDAFLTDVVMPKMGGKEAARQIQALCPQVKILFMSGYTGGVLDDHGILGEGVNLIQKPFSEASLLARLQELLPVNHDHAG